VLAARVAEGLASGVVQPIPAIIILRAFLHRFPVHGPPVHSFGQPGVRCRARTTQSHAGLAGPAVKWQNRLSHIHRGPHQQKPSMNLALFNHRQFALGSIR
jgi:hypothetical protein